MAVRPGDLTRWVASINQVHTAAGLDPPGRNEIVRRALSGIRRIRATPQNRRAPLLLSDIRTLMISIAETAGGWPAGVSARRDAALLLMGFAGAHRRSELVALTLADVRAGRGRALTSWLTPPATSAVSGSGRSIGSLSPTGHLRYPGSPLVAAGRRQR